MLFNLNWVSFYPAVKHTTNLTLQNQGKVNLLRNVSPEALSKFLIEHDSDNIDY